MTDEQSPNSAPNLSKKRKMILENALRIMRRKRDTMDKSVLNMIKDLVTSNPAMSKALGYELDEQPEQVKKATKKTEDKPQFQPQPKLQPSEEVIDQGHNMEVLAKLMALDPKGKDKVKAVIKKVRE